MKKNIVLACYVTMNLQALNYIPALETLPKNIQSDDTYAQLITTGKQHVEAHDYHKALACLKKALDYRPQEYIQCLELGNTLLRLGNHFFDIRQTDLALDSFKTILSIADSIAAVHHNIAFTLAEQKGDFTQALTHYQKALSIQPDNIETHFCASLTLLTMGDLINGFKEYEYRWKRVKDKPRAYGYPLHNLWTGKESVVGKRVLIRIEQGFGDSLMFIRYAKLLKHQGATVIVETHEALTHILSLCDYIDEIVCIGKPLPTFDYQIPMLNFPLAYGTSLKTIPTQIPYLRAHPHLVHLWKEILNKDQNFKIGVCWTGDVAHGKHKFMPFDYFERLAHLPGISIYSLQKNDATNAHTQNPESLIQFFETDFDTTHGGFMDTAAIMKNLDLIITVDTSIAHLAGGLGVPVWVVLPFPAEWRWLTERSDSPWYPTMRLFRQQSFGDWEVVFGQMIEALANKVRM